MIATLEERLEAAKTASPTAEHREKSGGPLFMETLISTIN
jgi:hypothetical protein